MDAVLLDRVSKRFQKVVLRSGYTTLKTALTNLRSNGSGAPAYVEALTDVNLTIPHGATLGILGRNGTGKSTLIRIIAGIYKPDTGRVATEGRISTLIELGAGFHPEFTGRENVYINGIILGLSKKEIRRRFDEIVEFAGIAEFIDAPVRTYSSGMYMRLGFSVAVHVDPDILLVDEVLAVGDEAFVRQCLDKMDEFKKQGKTIILAGHDLGLIERWCDRALLLEQGRVTAQGLPADVVSGLSAVAGGPASRGRVMDTEKARTRPAAPGELYDRHYFDDRARPCAVRPRRIRNGSSSSGRSPIGSWPTSSRAGSSTWAVPRDSSSKPCATAESRPSASTSRRTRSARSAPTSSRTAASRPHSSRSTASMT